jgi:hypothetical protein
MISRGTTFIFNFKLALVSLFCLSTASAEVFKYTFNQQFLVDVGYHIDGKLVEQSYFNYDLVKKAFVTSKLANPNVLKMADTTHLNILLSKLELYIGSQKNGKLQTCKNNECKNNFEDINGVSERELAQEIVAASYCFGTDPLIVASKVRQESKFDTRAISHTGAIGLTQLTTIGLEEILDQLGHRGAKYASLESKDFIHDAISCYVGDRKDQVLYNFPQVEIITKSKGNLAYSPRTIDSFKRWFSYSNSYSKSQKEILVKRQIILGQILLKIYLGFAYGTSKNKNVSYIYEKALRMFNGDRQKIRYAKEVMKKSAPGYSL